MRAKVEPKEDVLTGGAGRLQSLAQRVFPRRSLVELEALVPDLATGLRAATATVIPLSLATKLARPELTWMALGGWLGTLVDPGGSRTARACPLAAFAVLGALVVALSEAGAGSVVAAAGLVALIAFFASMLRALGASASMLGTMLSILAALATGSPSREPARDALGFAAGSLLAVILSSIVWPVWTHLPVRRALASVFHELETYALAIEQCLADGVPEDDSRWALVGRQHTRQVREAIEAARTVSLAIRARRAGESRLGGNLRVLLGMAESQFLWLVTLATEVEASRSNEQRGEVRSSLSLLAKTYDAISLRLVAALMSASFPPAQPASASPPSASGVQEDALRELTTDLERESRVARALAGSLDRSEIRAVSTDAGSVADPRLAVDWRLFRDALSPLGSPLVHHAVRVSVAGAASVVIGHYLSLRHAPWVTVTALVVLQPASGATVRRAAERVVGTILGGLVAVAIVALRPGPLELSAMMFPLSVAAVATRPRSYRLFTFFLTPIFVLVALPRPGDWWVAAERAGDTIAGGAVALGATLLLWPRWEERIGLPEALSAMTRAAESYASTVSSTLEAREAGALRRIAGARLSAAASVSRAEAALERLLDHPLGSGDAARALELVTYARRLVLATTTLDTLVAKGVTGRAVPTEVARARIERYRALVRRASSAVALREENKP